MFHIWLYPVEELIWSPPLIRCRRFGGYTNVSIASAQDCGGSPEPCDIAWVPLVATLFGEGEYGTDEMIRMPRSSQSSFIRPATSSFALSNITILTFLSVLFSIRLTHFPNSIGAFDFTPLPRLHHASEGTYVFHVRIYPVDELIWSVHHRWCNSAGTRMSPSPLPRIEEGVLNRMTSPRCHWLRRYSVKVSTVPTR